MLPIKSSQKLNIGDELIYDGSKIGTVMISGEYPFALIKLFNPDFDVFKDQEVKTSRGKVKIINNHYIL